MANNKYLNFKEGDIVGSCTFVKYVDSKTDSHKAQFLCNCSNLFETDVYRVVKNKTKSCGCLRNRSKRKYQRVKNTEVGNCIYLGDVVGNISYGHFKCKCGNEFSTLFSNVKSGNTKFCKHNCTHNTKKTRKTHGHSKDNTTEYITWCSLRNRCNNPNNSSYNHYGGRGIKVCDRWLSSFENFLEDMGYKPTPQHSIEREDVNGDYEPSNCRWATAIEQANNTRRNLYITYRGKTQTSAQWCREFNIERSVFETRIKSLGWDVGKALTTPSGTDRQQPLARKVVDVTTGIFFDSIREASKAYNLKEKTLGDRLRGVNPNPTNLELV
jgi:hypothetical protein